MNPAKPDKNKDPSEPREESLQERSARLEAEAAAKAAGTDPLAPEAETTLEDTDTAATGQDQTKIEALQNELDQAKDQMIRALAEAENARKRAAKEREDAAKFSIGGFAKDLLDVADNLRRALDAVPDDLVEADIRVKNLLDGIEATERELLKSFEKNGIQKLEPMGEMFDPNFHEVMFETPGTGQPPGTIIQVMDTGYVLNERLLRPARVGVAKDDGQDGGTPPADGPGGQIDTEV